MLKSINQLQQNLFILLGIFIPTSIAATNIIIGLISFLWIFQGSIKSKIYTIRSSKWITAIFCLIILYFLGMFWGETHNNYLWQFQRLALLLVFPVFFTLDLEKKTIIRAVQVFLFTALFSAVLAILININIVSESLHLALINEHDSSRHAAFITYNYHNVILALSTTICYYILTEKKTKHPYLICAIIAIFGVSIFTEKGRAGQVIFNLSSLYYILYYNRKYILRLLGLLFLLFSFQFIIYNSTNVYKARFDTAASFIKGSEPQGNINDRIVFIKESINRILERPILGHGTGSFGQIFINEVKSERTYYTHTTPHNQYLYVWFEIGFLGLLLLLFIFFFQIKELFNKSDGAHRILLPISFMFLMLVDSYFFIFILTITYIYLFTIYSKYQSE